MDKMSKPLTINKMPYIIAEVGINHNGSLDIAKQLISMAHRCGVDAVKFQKRSVDLVYSKEFLDSPRQSPFGSTQRDQKFGLELSFDDFDEIDKLCHKLGLDWFASCWDINSFNLMNSRYNWKHQKIASAMVTNIPFCEQVADSGIHTFISTGGCNINEISNVMSIFTENKTNFTLMHCKALYPCPTNLLNLSFITQLHKLLYTKLLLFPFEIGYSGHSPGIWDGVIAVVLGAVAIEKHITLDRTMYGSDQSASLEEGGLRKMVEVIRYVVDAMGDGVKVVTDEEQKVMDKLRYWL
jgi:N-acetylneuraminate synthase